ncbi:hypothetical protein BTN50_0990 [Candidatus Enterovibrio altilux]|uniref:Uncharacterized protein n=1 Tax=Candidatus Enterovibrio altilux TaxID=1927128 RepID=A0A291B918_9GAMM|nr:hypothetical protein BTN50_0990 [Candidatus Enterovibrio luxaltus]
MILHGINVKNFQLTQRTQTTEKEEMIGECEPKISCVANR